MLFFWLIIIFNDWTYMYCMWRRTRMILTMTFTYSCGLLGWRNGMRSPKLFRYSGAGRRHGGVDRAKPGQSLCLSVCRNIPRVLDLGTTLRDWGSHKQPPAPTRIANGEEYMLSCSSIKSGPTRNIQVSI